MRIFMTSDTYLPDIGGAEVHVFELQKYLRLQGDEVRLFVTNPRSDTEDVLFPVQRASWSLRRAPWLLLRMWKVSDGVEVYQSHYCHKLAFLTGIIAFLRRKPFFITLHGLGILDHPGTPWIYHLAHRLYRWGSLHLATHIISTSEDLATVCRTYVSAERISIIQNGLDTKAFSLQQTHPILDDRYVGAHPFLLTVRRLVPKNGIHYAISALPFLLLKYPQTKLVMIGDGRMREQLEKRAECLGVRQACVFLGTLPNASIASIAALADVVLFPSTAESTSIACAEMMSLERKIVASRVGGLIELLGRNDERGWLMKLVPWESCNYDAPDELSPETYKAFADKIMDAYESRDGSIKTRRAREFAIKRLDWHVVTRKTQEVYRAFSSG